MPLSHVLLALVICLAWGGNFLAAAVALKHFPPFFFTALRLGLVLVCLAPFLRIPPPGHRARLAAVACLSGWLHFGLNFWALRVAGDISSVAIATQAFIPISAILAAVLRGERVDLRAATGIGAAFAGVLVLGFDPLVLDAPAGLFVSLIAAFCLALGSTFARGLQGVDVVQIQGWTALLGLPFLLGISALTEAGQLQSLATAGLRDWAGVAYTALAASLVGHGLFYWLVQRHPIARVTPYLLLSPLFAVMLGVAVWGDRPGPKLLLGGALVLGGVVAVSLRRRPPATGAAA